MSKMWDRILNTPPTITAAEVYNKVVDNLGARKQYLRLQRDIIAGAPVVPTPDGWAFFYYFEITDDLQVVERCTHCTEIPAKHVDLKCAYAPGYYASRVSRVRWR